MERLDPRRLLSSTTPSIAGLWDGTRVESGLNSGAFATVTLDLNLTQSGAAVTGTERRTSPTDSEYFADIRTDGTMVGSTFDMQDQAITASRTTSNYKWLLYTASLTLSSDGQTLSGRWHSGHYHGSITLHRVPLPRLTLGASGTADHNSVVLHYAIGTVPVTHRLRFDVYRSSTPHLNKTSQLIGSQTLSPTTRASALTVASHRVTLLAGTSLTGNKARPYVIIVANGDNAIVDSPDSINSTFFKLTSF